MIILLGSTNPSKKRDVEEALSELGIANPEIVCVDSESGVSSKPIGYEIVRGADNRNQHSKEYALEKKLSYDYLCAIEGGVSLDENGLPFVVTYAIVEDGNSKKSTGKSLGIRLRKDMFDFVRAGGSLNELIGELNGNSNNKQLQGITGYLSNGLLRRDNTDKKAVISALIPFVFKEKADDLSAKILRRK